MKRTPALVVVILLCFFKQPYSQTSFIRGVINSYTNVTAISEGSCSAQLTVANDSAFSPGDKVLLIQMKGAVIDTSDDTLFGNILAINSAGNYEFNRITSIVGQNIYLQGALTHTYNVTGIVQLIRVPEYQNATVAGTLQSQPWNGRTGGVLALFVTDTLTLYSNINLAGQGFGGGNISKNPDGGCGVGSPGFYYNLYQPGTYWDSGGAMKGEGIAVLDTDKLAGRGKLGNGGGGGNKHNYGGAGGGNFTKGGMGGGGLVGCGYTNLSYGGLSLASYIEQDKLFLGGGSGCGDYNNGVGSNGVSGGGIAIIKAGTLIGNSDSIIASGADETLIGYGIADGVGGGGAGGLIFLDVMNYTTSLYLVSNGGHGGDQNPTYGRVGTGGGGGSGAVLTTQASLPGNVVTTLLPGRAGFFLPSDSAVYRGNYYATAGDTNIAAVLANMVLIDDTLTGGPIVNLGPDTAICYPDTLRLNASNAGNLFSWSNGATTQIIEVASAGFYAVTVTDTAGCSSSDSINISVSRIMDSVIVTNAACAANNGAVSVVVTSAVTPVHFVWSNHDTSAALSGLSSGNYTVTLTDAAGCTTVNSVTVISDSARPVIISANKISMCTGDTATICATGGYSLYQWNNGDTGLCINTIYAGNYYVTASSGTDCSVQSNYVDINVFAPQPVAITVNGDTIDCLENGPYRWYFNGQLILGDTARRIIVITAGDYKIEITDSNGCEVFSNDVLVSPTGISQLEVNGQSISIYPNPSAGGDIWLKANGPLIHSFKLLTIEGKVWKEDEAVNSATCHFTTNGLASGTYLVQVTNSAGNIFFRKLVVLSGDERN